MPTFPVHTPESAPEGSREHLEAARRRFGMVPNLIGVLATAPAAAGGYLALTAALEGSSLSPVEQQTVLIATSAYNRCEYCVSVHSAVARAVGMPDDALEALRAGRGPDDPRLAALARFARHVVEERGWVDDAEIEAFLGAGFEEQQVLEVVTGVALKTLSNYANHIAGTPLDAAFESLRWTADTAA
jgi:uncharacterized peroxidase-related enzyme